MRRLKWREVSEDDPYGNTLEDELAICDDVKRHCRWVRDAALVVAGLVLSYEAFQWVAEKAEEGLEEAGRQIQEADREIRGGL